MYSYIILLYTSLIRHQDSYTDTPVRVRITDVDVFDYIRNNIDDISHHLEEAIRTCGCIKWFAMMDVAFQRTTVDGDVQHTTVRFRTQPEMLSDASNVTTESMTAQFSSAIENYNKIGCSLLIERILDFCITLRHLL